MAEAGLHPAAVSARLVGGCWAVPVGWDGTLHDLPSGYTDALRFVTRNGKPSTRPAAAS